VSGRNKASGGHRRYADMALKGGARFRLEHGEVFPAGCLLIPGSIGPVEDYDEASRLRTPAFDKVTGLRLYQARVIDRDPALGRARGRRW
jgi:hypothetical protein